LDKVIILLAAKKDGFYTNSYTTGREHGVPASFCVRTADYREKLIVRYMGGTHQFQLKRLKI
jgi:hypothetical protein